MNYTSYLKTVTEDLSAPYLAGVSTIYLNHVLEIYITINYAHLKNRSGQKNWNYTLYFKSSVYNNVYTTDKYSGDFNQLKFIISDNSSYQNNDIITFTLKDHLNNRTYCDVKSCITIPPKQKYPLITCSYISDYNTIAEIRSFIAFHRIQKVSKIVLYLATPIIGFEKAFEKLINSGYLIVIDFTWPRPKNVQKKLQRTNQLAQINSCYNHYRFFADALIMCDVDEYIYSVQFPYNLPSAIHNLVKTYSNRNVFIVYFI